jgi:hypothetical protein
VKIRVILVMGLVALGSSAVSAEPLFSPMFGQVAPPRPPRLIGRSNSHPPAPPSRPAAARAKKPEQNSAAVRAPANPNVVTIGPSAAAPDPAPTGNTLEGRTFPPVQTLE